MFVFINPAKQNPQEKKITWDMAQNEIAEAKGFSVKNTSLTKGCFHLLIQVLKVFIIVVI